MREILGSLKRHQFFSLSGGILAANLLSLLTMPILTRIYSIEAFGIFAIFWAMSTLLGTFASLRLEQALPILKDWSESVRVARTAWLLAMTAVLAFFALWTLTPIATVIKAAPGSSEFGLTVALMALGQAVAQIQIQLAIQTGQMKALSLRHFVEKLTTVAGSIAFAHYQTYGLIFAQLIGTVVANLLLASALKMPILGFVSPRNGVDVLKRYGDYPLKNGASAIFTILSAQLPPLFYSFLFPVQMLGFYNLAQRLIEAPNTIVGSAVSVVYYRRMLTAERSAMAAIYRRALRWTALALFVPMLIVGLISEPLITRLFGQAWAASAVFLVLLLPLAFFRMLFMTGQSLFLVLRKLHLDMTVMAAVFFSQIVGLVLGYAIFRSLSGSVALASALTSLAYGVGLYLLSHALKTGADKIENSTEAVVGQQTT